MFPLVMMVAYIAGDATFGSAEKRASKRQASDVFQYVGVLYGGCCVFAPGERRMSSHEDSGHGDRIEIVCAEMPYDDLAGVANVGLFNFLGG